jgi:glycosyltransferase involved in cell wall biosynthesis
MFKPDGEAETKLRAEWGISEHTRLIGTVGRVDPMKDLPTFLEAAAIVAGKRDDVRFACVGAGPQSYVLELRQLANELGIGDLLLWTGARGDISAVYNALDVLVSSSYGEGLPNVVGEAMACGVPCVVTDTGDSASLVGQSGIVVSPRNPEALAAGLISSLETDRDEFGRKMRTRLVENFSVHQLAERTEKHLLALIQP